MDKCMLSVQAAGDGRMHLSIRFCPSWVSLGDTPRHTPRDPPKDPLKDPPKSPEGPCDRLRGVFLGHNHSQNINN